MPPLTPLVFVPLSLETGHFVARIEQLAAAQGKSVQVSYVKASDATVLDRTADVTIYHEVEYGAFTHGGPEWTVVPALSLDSYLGFFQTIQPDLPDHWSLTQASGAAAVAHWLEQTGGQVITFDDIPEADTAFVSRTTSKLMADMHGKAHHAPGTSWDWRDAFIATSPEYKPDENGWVDLTGRARHILTGPFIFIQPGIWNVVMDIEVDVETGVPRFAFQWGGASLEKTLFTTLVRKSGRYQVSVDAKISKLDAAHCLVATDAAQLQGFLRLDSFKLTYVSALDPAEA